MWDVTRETGAKEQPNAGKPNTELSGGRLPPDSLYNIDKIASESVKDTYSKSFCDRPLCDACELTYAFWPAANGRASPIHSVFRFEWKRRLLRLGFKELFRRGSYHSTNKTLWYLRYFSTFCKWLVNFQIILHIIWMKSVYLSQVTTYRYSVSFGSFIIKCSIFLLRVKDMFLPFSCHDFSIFFFCIRPRIGVFACFVRVLNAKAVD